MEPDDMENTMSTNEEQTSDVTEVESELEGGESSAPDSVPKREIGSVTRKSHREPKPVIKLTYDEPGNPSNKPVTIMHHGMVIQFKLNSSDKSVRIPTKKHRSRS